MYIKTEDNKIINLNHYRIVEVFQTRSDCLLRAILSTDSDKQRKHDETIARFDKEEEALIALDDLFSEIRGSKQVWNSNAYKDRRQHQLSLRDNDK